MGQVYRARDTKLQRDVAIKVLPDLVAADRDRRLRFEREAQLLASLNHPNIAQIYGLEEVQGGHLALAMELVEGDTLATLIARGTPPQSDALAIAKQIALGLEAAHEKGIIHRDLKPANVMVTTDGHVKILDFGLGKALEGDASRDASNSPTLTLGATQAGMILGTAAYMSPEQAKGRAADKRSDVWAFGCVLYELLTGKRAFGGDDVSETLASVLKDSVDLSRLPATTPANVRVIIEKCLSRDRSTRLPDISTARFLLDDGATLAPGRMAPAHAAPSSSLSRGIGWTAALVVTAMAITAAATYWLASKPAVETSAAATHVSINFPEGDSLAVAPDSAMNFALSPDGRRVVFAGVSGGVSKLYDRGLDADLTKAIPGTEGASLPFFSPNGRSIGFFAQDKLKKVALGGGTVETLADAKSPRGGSWGDDGFVYFTTTNVSPIFRVSETGGAATAVTKLKPEQGEISHRWPQVLPGGKGLLFSIWTGPGPDEKWIAVQSLPAGDHQVVIKGGTSGRYLSPGYLLYTRDDDLFVVPMNASTLTVDKATPVTVPVRVLGAAREGSDIAVSQAGAFAYLPAAPARLERRLVWLDEKGATTEIPLPHKLYEQLAISPDGRTAVVQVQGASIELWLLNLERYTLTPFVTTGGSSQAPVWTPDGRHIIYRATRNGVRNLYWKSVDGGEEERLVTKPGFLQTPSSVRKDANGALFVSFSEVGVQARGNWTLQLDGARATAQIPQHELTTNIQFSPDGKWIAFESAGEVYVQPFPGPGQRVPISSGGAVEPLWSHDGRKLYFVASGNLMEVDISSSPSFLVGKPRTISTERFEGSPNSVTGYSLGKDGRLLRVQSLKPEGVPTSIRLVLNLDAELKTLVR